jgi:hypothetical protein
LQPTSRNTDSDSAAGTQEINMNVRLTFPALVGAMLIAGSAYAATPTMPGQATNSVKSQHKSASGFTQAEKYYNDGVKMCGNGNKDEGAKLIDKALHAIGVNPVS